VIEQTTEPLAVSVQSHMVDSNDKVTGVQLTVWRRPNTRYSLKLVYLLNEYEAEGKTLCYNYFEGIEPGQLWLLTGYQGNPNTFDERQKCTSDKGEIPITARFYPPNLGPLAVEVGEGDSDLLASLGLPGGRHVSFVAVWGPRVTVIPGPDTEPTTPAMADFPAWATEQIQKLQQRVAALEFKIGV
jgi:hypothetical protein